jgi:type I restriction enzyme S subunit
MNGVGLSEAVISVGEVLIARSNTADLVGRAAVYAGDPATVVASDLTIRIAPSAVLLPEFLGAYLSYLFVSGHWKRRAGGASGSMKKITRTQVAALEVPVPPIDGQACLVSEIRGSLGAATELRSQAQAELTAIEALPAVLLRKAFGP